MKKTIYLERSTGEVRDGGWVERLNLPEGLERIVVGMGPGSFAGVRSALAFAEGYCLGSGCEVFGLSSAAAIAGECRLHLPETQGKTIAVVGDARQGKFWTAQFRDFECVQEVRLEEDLCAVVANLAPECLVVSPDDRRIGVLLKREFSGRYLGEVMPTAEGLEAFASARPEALVKEPLPIYLNPAVR